MSPRRAGAGWTVLHLCYPSLAARVRLIADHLVALGDRTPPGGSWFFVDVRVPTAAGERFALEVAMRRGPGAPLGGEDTAAWLRPALAAGLLDSIHCADAPLVLQPQLFPGGWVPAFYPWGLAVGSVRAMAVLRSVASVGAERASRAAVRQELALTYAALLTDAAERRTALLEHAAWLERVPGAGTDVTEADDFPDDEGGGALLGIAAAAYAPIRHAMRRQVPRLAARSKRRADPAPGDPSMARIALVARLAHTQAIRLSGPVDARGLMDEAALVRGLTESPLVRTPR